MSGLITCMGEILIDFLPIEEDGRTVGFRMHPGGSPLNVAVGTARMGQPAAFAGKVAADFFGRHLRGYVESEGIDTRFLLTVESPTTLAFVAYEGGDAAYAFYGDAAADTLLSVDDMPPALFEETSALQIGSISLLRGTTPAAILATAERLKGRALISLDPNIRPGLVRDEAGYRALLDRLFALADVVKISTVDLDWLAPGQPVEATMADLMRRGPALVVVTRGGEGVLALHGGRAYAEDSFPVTVIDTIGAGDTYDAGLLVGLAERGALSREKLEALAPEELSATLRFAGAAAAINCSRAGANPPSRAEVAAFLARHGGSA